MIFNAEGDLLFSCSKDLVINTWYSHSGERLSTYDGNNGTVWTVDVDCIFHFIILFVACANQIFIGESQFLVSGSADNTLRLWSWQQGNVSIPGRVAFNEDDTKVVCITEQRTGDQCAIRVFDMNREGDGTNRTTLLLQSKATVCAFTLMPNIIMSRERSHSGFSTSRQARGSKTMSAHSDVVTDQQLSKDHTYCVTSSKDKIARIYYTKTLLAALALTRPYVLGGGQEAMNVTTTSLRQGKFETPFWHKVYEEEVGPGAFGPRNTIADGFVRVHHFDDSYFKVQLYDAVDIGN
ncbi:eukaryotic translation initiation factor 3 [Mycena galericulata]|nr:eukaryotic translation initiation factor 3 [Mycena galericulata]